MAWWQHSASSLHRQHAAGRLLDATLAHSITRPGTRGSSSSHLLDSRPQFDPPTDLAEHTSIHAHTPHRRIHRTCDSMRSRDPLKSKARSTNLMPSNVSTEDCSFFHPEDLLNEHLHEGQEVSVELCPRMAVNERSHPVLSRWAIVGACARGGGWGERAGGDPAWRECGRLSLQCRALIADRLCCHHSLLFLEHSLFPTR